MNFSFATLAQPEMKITEVQADARHLRVLITARKDGIIAAILNAMGMTGTASMKGDVEGCTIEQSSFSGQSRTYISWANVSASFHSVTRATGYLGIAFPMVVIGVGAFLGGPRNASPMLGMLMLGLAAILVVLFFIKRSVMVGVLTTGGTVESLKLKGSAAEMEELKAAMQVMEMLNRAASEGDAHTHHESHAAPPRTPAPAAPPAPSSDTNVATCPNCQARMKVPAGREGHAMRCPKCSQSFTV